MPFIASGVEHVDIARWKIHCKKARIAVASFALLSQIEETARKAPATVGIYKPRLRIVRNDLRETITFEAVSSRLTDKEFRMLFRMTRIDFYELLELVRPHISKNIEMGKRGGNATVLSATRLAITIRMLAGARYGDLMMLYAISKTTVYSVFHDTMEALNRMLKLPLLPDSEDGLRWLADGMKTSRARGSPLDGCIGALDGICIRIEKPKADMNPALFYCRKGYYAIPVQALVDHSYRFLCASANCAGSTHDSLAHSASKLGVYLMKVLLGKPYWIAGDEAYVCTEFLLTPYPASQVVGFIFRDSFNFYLSSLRMHVEQAFGMLKAKWLILDNLRYDTKICSNVIILAMKLHNYCLDTSLGTPSYRYKRSQREMDAVTSESEEWYKMAKADDFDRVDRFGTCATFGEPTETNFRDAASIEREHFVALLELTGRKRPQL